MKKVYIAGPISNRPEPEARAEFQAAQDKFESMGYTVVNPMNLPHNHDKSWEAYMREDLREMLTCDWVVMLPNWMNSKGASLEYQVAKSVGIAISRFSQFQ